MYRDTLVPILAGFGTRVCRNIIKDENPKVRAKAASVLSLTCQLLNTQSNQPPPEFVVAALTDALKDNDIDVRFQAAKSLGDLRSGVSRAVPILIEALDNPDYMPGAVSVIGNFGLEAAAAVPHLLEILKAPLLEPNIYKLIDSSECGSDLMQYLKENYPASSYLAHLEEEGVISAVVVMGPRDDKTLELYWENGRKEILGASTYHYYIPIYSSDIIQYLIIYNLAEISREPEVLEILFKMANNSDDGQERSAAVYCLRNFVDDGKRVVPFLIKKFKEDEEVRFDAISILGQFKEYYADVVPILIRALDDPDRHIKHTAIISLGEFGPKAYEALPALYYIIDNYTSTVENPDFLLLVYTAEAIIKIGVVPGKEGEDTILRLVHHKNPFVRNKGFEALGALGPISIPYLVEFLGEQDPSFHSDAIGTLGKLGKESPEVASYIIPFLKDKDFKLREVAAQAIAEIGANAEEAVPLLAGIIESADIQYGQLYDINPDGMSITVHGTIEPYVAALGEIGPDAKAAVPVLISFLPTERMELRIEIMLALAKIGKSAVESIPIIIDNLSAENPDVRKAAIQALSLFGPLAKDATKPLTEMLGDKNPIVRWKAVIALGSIGTAAADALQQLQSISVTDPNSEVRKAAMEAVGKIEGG